MITLENYALGRWLPAGSDGALLLNAVTGEPVAQTGAQKPDFEAMLAYARTVGNPALRLMTFHERGRMLKALAFYLSERKEKYYELSYATGATRMDSWIDIDGGIGNLFVYSSLRRQFPDKPFFTDGDTVKLSKQNTFIGHHIMVPKEGVALHINAFNFPVWGMLEKIAVNLLAGMPAVVKPATLTSYLAEAVVRDIDASGILPSGALQLICGSASGVLDHVTSQDVVTFTGSASTGLMLKAHPRVQAEAVPFNMEADSLNAAILGPDAPPGTAEFDLFIKEVRKEITVKCGQKCTAVRRIIVPEGIIEDVIRALDKVLTSTAIGNPRHEAVRMGSLAGKTQQSEVHERLLELLTESNIVVGSTEAPELLDASATNGAFVRPVLLLNERPFERILTHNVEVFGPVATLMPYTDIDEAIAISKLGKGSLVCSLTTNDAAAATRFTLGAATHHGRILILNAECAKESTGHGSPMPMLTHGGPGRAGGGEEMGGKRGVYHYMQRTAIQGSPAMLTAITDQFQYGGNLHETPEHLFRKHFEDLQTGDTVITAKHTVSEADIVNFANVSGDNFYAHMDATSLDGTIFTGRVAHGYFVLSKAAGLFVDARKGPVLLNYGLEDCRFTKPVYPGMTIGVRLTVKEKIAQEKRTPEDISKGIVKFLVDVYDETGETVALATILTMVKMKNQG